MEEDLIAKLLTLPVASTVSNQIYWLTQKQGELPPAIELTKVASLGQVNMDGVDHLVESVVQFDCWATSFATALVLSRAIKALIGTSFTQGATRFQGIFYSGERQSFEDYGEQSPIRYYRVSLDLRLWHNE